MNKYSTETFIIIIYLIIALSFTFSASGGEPRYSEHQEFSDNLFAAGKTKAEVQEIMSIPRLQANFDWDKMDMTDKRRVVILPGAKAIMVEISV